MYSDGPLNKAQQVKKWCAENPENVRVAEIEKKVEGFITWSYHNSEVVELCENAVSPAMHRKGVGSAMYDWFFKYMKESNFLYTYVFTGLDSAHKPARKAYEKMGFKTPISNVKYYKEL